MWRDRILPRLVIPAYWICWTLLAPAGLGRRRASGDVRLGIESGRVGWTHVYFEELLASAGEYLGPDRVAKVVIDRDLPYLPQFRRWVDASFSHVLLDVRTGPQTWPRGITACLAVAWRLRRRRITPIVVLTDASLRRHRLQAAVLTAFSGVVVTFMSSQLVAPMFPHRRVLGPMPMPVSVGRLRMLEETRASAVAAASPTISFIGGNYLPRSIFLAHLAEALEDHGLMVRVHANKYETANEDYWRILATSDIIVTTTMQGMPRPDMDWIWIPQLVFRFSEALSAGAVLVAPSVVGAERFFTEGADFVSFVSVDDARDALVGLVADAGRRERIRATGHATAARLAEQHGYWSAIDECLGSAALGARATGPPP